MLKHTNDPLKLILEFKNYFPKFNEKIPRSSYIRISDFQKSEFNYSLNPNSNLSFLITLTTSKRFVASPLLTLTLNLKEEFLIMNNLYLLQKEASISLMEYYALSETEKEMMNSVNGQSKAASTVATSSGYASFFLSSGSPLFIQGLMMIEMIFCLKYIGINYPENAKLVFKNKENNPKLIFQVDFDEKAEDTSVLPKLYQDYNVSPYFLENVGENLCQIVALILISTLILLATPYETDKAVKMSFFKKALFFVKNVLVWELCLFFILLSLQKIVFFMASDWMFQPVNLLYRLLNSIPSFLISVIILLWLLHLLAKIKVFHKLKQLQEETEVKVKRSTTSNMIYSRDEVNRSEITSSNRSHIQPLKNLKKNTVFAPYNFKKNEYKMALEDVSTDQIISPQITHNSTKPLNEKNKSFCSKLSGIIHKIHKFFFVPKDPSVYLQRYKALHLEYNSYLKYYPFFYYLRQISVSFLVVLLWKYPLLSIVSINIVNLIFLLYTIFGNPFVSKFYYFVSIINELITITAFLAAMLIAIFDAINEKDYEKRLILGWLIVYANNILLFWVIFTGISKLIYDGIRNRILLKKKLAKIVPENN